eukprot:7380774-Prymnesium_polylepis.2
MQLQVGALGKQYAANAHLSTTLAPLMAPLEPRVLVRTRGSGNFGESSDDCAFYTLKALPSMLAELAPPAQPAVRHDIDLGAGGLAFTIEGVLTSQEADSLAACAEAIYAFNGHSRFAPGIQTPAGMRQNMAAHWFPEHGARGFFDPLYSRFQHLLPAAVGGQPLFARLNEKIACFKYGEGDQFKPHHDGIFPGQAASEDGVGVDEWVGVQSGLSMLLYLNDQDDGLQGGETRLFRPDGSGHVDVRPKKGMALFFRHGSGHDSILHASLCALSPAPTPVPAPSSRPGVR